MTQTINPSPTTYWATERAMYWWDKLCDHYDWFESDPPTVEFSKNLVCVGGKAYSSENRIVLSLAFMKQEGEVYDRTIAHEICHIFADRYHAVKCHHDPRWGSKMVALGFQPTRCHSYKIISNILLVCPGCNKVHHITKNRRTRLLRGKRYICRICKSSMGKWNLRRSL